MLSYFDSSGQACSYAVVIAQGRAHDRGHTSSVYCLEINGFGVEEQIHGNPFRLLDCNRFLWDNEDLRTKEINIGSIVFVDRLGKFLGSTGLKMGKDQVLSQLRSNEAVLFRGIADAFPNAVIPSQGKGIYQKTTKPDPSCALIGVQDGYTRDDRIVVTTLLGEVVDLNNRSRAYKPSSIETVPLPVHHRSSIDDVSNVMLVAFGSKTPQGSYQAVCEDILIWSNSGQTEEAQFVLNPVKHAGVENFRKLSLNLQPSDEPQNLFITPTDPSKLPAHIHPDSVDVYPMMSNPRGIALIINNEVFSPSAHLKDRQGSEKDVEALERMFKALYFEVNIERNLGKEKILEVLDKVAKGDHTGYDCFVLCLMSHGQEGLFYGSDGQAVPFDTVCDLFSNSNCRTLRGKPKLIFIQACRGTEGQTGVVNDSPFCPGPQQPTATSVRYADRGWNFSFKGTIPHHSDFLLAYSTVNHYVSYRNELDGSRFVRCLVEVFQEKVGHEDVLSMLIMVNDKLSKMGEIGKKQIGQPTTTLTKKLFLWPGLCKEALS